MTNAGNHDSPQNNINNNNHNNDSSINNNINNNDENEVNNEVITLQHLEQNMDDDAGENSFDLIVGEQGDEVADTSKDAMQVFVCLFRISLTVWLPLFIYVSSFIVS